MYNTLVDEQPGLDFIKLMGPQIFAFWQKMRDEHPEHDDLVAVVVPHLGDQYALTIGTRDDFIHSMRDSGRWKDDSAWGVVLKPAADTTHMPRSAALWVVLHLPDHRSAILRLVNPPLTVTKGGSA